MRKIATIAALAALISAPHAASAADLGGSMKDMPPPVMVTNWTGFYVSAGIGFGAMADTFKYNNTRIDDSGFQHIFQDHREVGADGVLGTVQIGYDYLFPASRWLVGAFVDYDWENFKSSHDRNYFGLGPNSGDFDNFSLTLKNQWNVGGRLGLITTPDTMIYGLLAYTQAQLKASIGDNLRDWDGNIVGPLSGTATLDGVTVGAGIETRLRDNWFFKLEYRFSQFSSDKPWDRELIPQNIEHCWGEVDSDIHTARLSLTYKFARQGAIEPLK